MDIARQPTRGRGGLVQAGIAAGAVMIIILVLMSMRPAAPSVERAARWVDSVRRGEMLIQVGGRGHLCRSTFDISQPVRPAASNESTHDPAKLVQPQTLLLEL